MRAILAGMFVLVSIVAANAESPDWTTVQRACGTEYREADKAKRPTWSEFLNECKVRKGFVPKRASRTDVRLPDVVQEKPVQ